MKVIIVLALALAVANAAFTGSLVQQTKPLLNKARQNMQMAAARNVRARSAAEAGFQTAFINGLVEQAGAIMEQIQSAIEAGSAIYENIAASIQNVLGQLQNVGQEAAGSIQNIIQNFLGNFGNFFGSGKRASIDITPEMSGIMQMVLSNPTFVNLFRSEPMYQCLKSEGITVDHAHMQALNQANQLNINLLNKPEVRRCLNKVGGMEAVLQGPTSQFLQGLVDQLNIRPLVHSVLTQLLGADIAQQVIAMIHSRQRGFFDGLSNLWGAITEGASNAWESVSNGVSNQWNAFTEMISNMVSGVVDSATTQFQQAQAVAQMVIQGGIAHAQQLGLQGAQALVNWLAPFHSDLGQLWDNVVDELSAIYGSLLQIPIFGN